MSTQIKYQNVYNTFITEKQATKMDLYHKLTYVNNELKTYEEIFESRCFYGEYFLAPDEDLESVKSSLPKDLAWFILYNQETFENYSLYSIISNKSPINAFPSKIIKDNHLNTIAIFSYDDKKSLINATKILYVGGKNIIVDDEVVGIFDEGEEFTFDFDKSGNIEMINIPGPRRDFDVYYTLESFIKKEQDFINSLFTPKQFAYYTKLEPLLPDF